MRAGHRGRLAAGAAGTLIILLAAAGLAARGQGFDRVPTGVCPDGVSQESAGLFPERPGRDRALLPVGYRDLAPVDAVVCRYGADGRLRVGLALDAARTAYLAGVLAMPAGEWPSDPLAAKTIHPLSDAELAAAAAPDCAAASSADLVRVRYGRGRDAAVLVLGTPCRDAVNGVIRLRAEPELLGALDELPRE